MKNLKNTFALFAILVLTVGLYSCDSDVSIDDPQTQTIEDISADTGDQGNESSERE